MCLPVPSNNFDCTFQLRYPLHIRPLLCTPCFDKCERADGCIHSIKCIQDNAQLFVESRDFGPKCKEAAHDASVLVYR